MGAAELEESKVFCQQIPFTQAEAMLVGAESSYITLCTSTCTFSCRAWIIFAGVSAFYCAMAFFSKLEKVQRLATGTIGGLQKLT